MSNARPEIKRLLSAVIDDESARSRADIKSAKTKLADLKAYYSLWAVETAIDTAGFLKLADTEPDIRSLEAWLPSRTDLAAIMQITRQSLRTMGKTPAPGCGVQLYEYIRKEYYITSDPTKPFTAAVPTETRNRNAPTITAGMTLRAVCDAIGCPDGECYDGGTAYDYDIDAIPPYTLRVITENMETVKEVRTLTPFAFLHDPKRMYGR